MRRITWVLLLAAVAASLVATWLWWVRPREVDMASYAPANSLLYLESNRPLAVVEAIVGTEAWKVVDTLTGTSRRLQPNDWSTRFVSWTGIGPIQSVILSRAQLAVIVTDLGTTEEGDTLRVKPEGAVVIQTHTAESRIRAPVEQALKELAYRTYGAPTSRRTTIDGVELIEWAAPGQSRQIVAAIVGSLVIVGNSERAVQTCLTVALRRAASLRDDPELGRMRLQLAADRALTFGYVPPGNSARLLSVGVPLILGRDPGDPEFERFIGTSAAKVFGSIGWSSHQFMKGIEDRYLISLQPSILARLKLNFTSVKSSSQIQGVLPDDIYSVTYYKFENPSGAWQDLKTAVSSQVDVLSAVVFSSLLKAALLPYGIDEPEQFLASVNSELLTMRANQNAERSMLIAGVRDRVSLRALVAKSIGPNMRSSRIGPAEIFEDSQGEIAVSFVNQLIVMGSPPDVRRYCENLTTNSMKLDDETLRRMTYFVPFTSPATVVTYTNDSDRIRSFVSAIVAASAAPTVTSNRLEQMIDVLPYSATETTLGERGLERTTRSPLGQFSTLLPLVFQENSSLSKSGPHSN